MSSPKYLVVCASGSTTNDLQHMMNEKLDNIKIPEKHHIISLSRQAASMYGNPICNERFNTCIRIEFAPTPEDKTMLSNTAK